MPRFGISQHSTLVLVFSDTADLARHSLAIASEMVRLYDKYRSHPDKHSPILTVFNIPVMQGGTLTTEENGS